MIHIWFHFLVPYSPFFSHVREYWQAQDSPAVLFVRYEDLSHDPAAVVRSIADHLNVGVPFAAHFLIPGYKNFYVNINLDVTYNPLD